MSATSADDIVIHASHRPDVRRWIWVAADGSDHALAVVSAVPIADFGFAIVRGVLTVVAGRRLGTRLLIHARDDLAAQKPPITLYRSGMATPEGHRACLRAELPPFPGKAADLARRGIGFEPYPADKARESGLRELREAAERLGLHLPLA